MAIDASIYQQLRPVEVPSMMDSQQKAATLGNLAMQNQHMGQQMQSAKRQEDYNSHLQKASQFGQELEGLAGMSPQERASAWPGVKDQLVKQGVLNPMDAPSDHDEGYFRQSLMKYRQSKEGIERELEKAKIGNLNAEAGKNWASAGLEKRGKHLAAEQSDKLAGHDASLKQIQDLEDAVRANQGIMGPIAGPIMSSLPYATRSQSLQALTGAAAQKVGKSLEGGKLTDADIERYKKMLPTNSDSPDVALQKISQVRRMVSQQQSSDLDAYGKSGLDVSRFSPAQVNDISITKKQAPRTIVRSAMASDQNQRTPTSQLSTQDMEAIHWAQKNKSDPRSQQILQMHGMNK